MKKNVKTIIVVGMVALLAVSATACGKKSAAGTNATTEAVENRIENGEAKLETVIAEGVVTDIVPEEPVSENAETLPDPEPAYMCGGWAVNSDTSLEGNPEGKEAFEKATEFLVGASYEPIAVLASQVVAGRNFCVLAKRTIVVPDAQPQMVLAYVYADLSGNAQLTGTKTLPEDFNGDVSTLNLTEIEYGNVDTPEDFE